MKKLQFILLFFMIAQLTIGQKSDSIRYEVKTRSKSIGYTKIINEKELKFLKNDSYPFYIIDTLNFAKIDAVVKLLVYYDKQTEILKNKNAATAELEKEYNNIIKTQEDRITIYQDAYDQMKDINIELSNQLGNAIEIGRRSEKRNKFNNVIFGVLGGLVSGITVGVILSN